MRRAVCCLTALALLGIVLARAHDAQAAGESGGALFRIDSPGRAPSWIFGTIRSSDSRVSAIPRRIMQAMAASRRYAPEMSLTPSIMPGFAGDGLFDDGRRLADYFDAATLARLRFALGRHAPPPATFDRLKPWAALLLLREPDSEGDGPTLDAVLLARAREQKMGLVALELVEEQVASLDTLPVVSQVAIVRHSLDHLADIPARREAEIDAWLAHDLDGLLALDRRPRNAGPEVSAHFAEQARHLVFNRSVQMAHRLFLPLREGRVFVAVGAVQLPGPEGLLALLRAQGYRIRRVYRRAPPPLLTQSWCAGPGGVKCGTPVRVGIMPMRPGCSG